MRLRSLDPAGFERIGWDVRANAPVAGSAGPPTPDALLEFLAGRWPLLSSLVSRRRRDCHFADVPSPSLLKRLPEGEGDAAE